MIPHCESTGQRKRGRVDILIGLLLALFFLQSCGTRTRVILPAEEADIPEVLPDGRHISHSGKNGPMILDVATGEEVSVPEVDGMEWIGDGLFLGEKHHLEDNSWTYYVVNLQPVSVVELSVVSGKDLTSAIQASNSIYLLDSKTASGRYTLLLLNGEPSGQIVSGFYIDGVSNPDEWLAGRPYKTRTPPLVCGGGQRSPDGQYYYIYVSAERVQIYSQQGKLVNSISSSQLGCYGWAWDSSGVYVQSGHRNLRTGLLGPLLLLESK